MPAQYEGPDWLLVEYKGNNKYARQKVLEPKVSPIFLHNMFPFERFMGVLKKYALEEIIKLLFISLYHDKCLLFMLELY